MRVHDSDFPMKEIDITKLRPFDIEEWRKDTTQKVYTASGHEVAKLTDFEVGDFPISGVFIQQKNAWRHSGHWVCEWYPTGNDLRLAPKWQLDPPPWGAWHRTDWTEDMLPEGYRPLMDREELQEEDEYCDAGDEEWRETRCVGMKATSDCCHWRTRRPLPDPKPEPTISRLKSDVSRLRNALEQLLNMQDSRDKYEPLRAAQKDAMEALKATARE